MSSIGKRGTEPRATPRNCEAHRPTRVRPLATAVGAAVAGVSPFFLLGALAPQMGEELGYGAAQLGGFIAVFLGAGGAIAFLAGVISDRVGATKVVRIGLGLTIAAALFVGASQEVSWLWLGVGLAGAGNAFAEAGAHRLLATEVCECRHGLAFGVKMAGPQAGGMMAGLSVPLVALTVGWRWTFLGVALLALVPLAIAGGSEGAPTEPSSRVAVSSPGVPVGALSLLSVAMCLAVAASSSLAGFLVSGALEVGLTQSSAGLLLSTGALMAILVRLAAGIGSDYIPRREVHLVTLMLLVGGLGYMALGAARPGVFALGAILAFLGWSFPGLMVQASVGMLPDRPGTASSIVMTGAFVGGVAGPVAFGRIAAAISFAWAWHVLSVLCLLAILALVALIIQQRTRG